ncbi:preprotein translocase subunit SecG [Ferrimonas aestuarii]|uniref:Protein-export membrane protein SecG n=1 Tax=Ferrimonas aestuarii TaxID=2569539 RepID=A0A4U1BPC6_9GAMM|nr:preprotein translocase subunit SecG [Ferrimonas aestuarii]TKB55382.1 preprotein translocase subunit SecG [Ferrimonas aestuarii]
MLYTVLMVSYLVVALAIIGLVLIQQGKGADMGASFGAGASGTLFGSGGSGNFLTRATAICAVLFFVLSLSIGNMSSHKSDNVSDFETIEVEQPVQDDLPQ